MTAARLVAARRVSYCIALSSWAAGLGLVHPAAAQSAPPPPPQAFQNGQQQQSNATQQLRAPQFEPPGGSFATLTDQRRINECLPRGQDDFTELEFTGASPAYSAQVQAIIDRVGRRRLDCAALDKVRADIYDLYDRAGFPLTQIRVELLPDSPRKLRLHIIEARIGESGFCKNHNRRPGHNNAFPIRKGEQFTMGALDQGVDNLNQMETFEPRVPQGPKTTSSTDVDCTVDQGSTVTIKPGKAVGEGVVTVQTIQKRPFIVTGGIDNLGSRSTGRTRLNGQVAVEDALGLYERFEVGGSHTTGFNDGADRARNLNGAFTVPLGYWRFSLSGNYFDYRSSISVANQAFVTSGDQGYYALDLGRVVSRNQHDRWIVGGSLAIKDSNNFINGLKLATSSRQLTLLSARVSYDHSLRNGGFAGTVTLTQGIKQLGALDDSHIVRAQPHAQYTQVGLVLSYRRDLALGKLDEKGQRKRRDIVRLQSVFSGSYAPHALYGTEQVQIGGPFTVRGFDDTSLSGDIGGFVRNEASYIAPFPPLGEYGQIGFFGGVDGGWIVRNYADKSLEKALAGVAGGFRASGRNVRAEARVEKAVASPSYFKRAGAIFRFTLALSI